MMTLCVYHQHKMSDERQRGEEGRHGAHPEERLARGQRRGRRKSGFIPEDSDGPHHHSACREDACCERRATRAAAQPRDGQERRYCAEQPRRLDVDARRFQF
jgi:hypothetical protein